MHIKTLAPRATISTTIVWLGLALLCAPTARAQDWFRTGTGLGVEKARVAVSDFVPRSDTTRPLGRLFTDVVVADLEFSGILEIVSRSFYPLSIPSVPTE